MLQWSRDRSREIRRLAAMGAIGLAAVVAAGCGNITTPASSSTSSTSTSSSTTTGTTGTTTKTGTATKAGTTATNGTIIPVATLKAQYTAKGSATLSAGKALTMTVGDFYFKPNTLSVTKGTKVDIHVTNHSALPHTFTLPAWHVNVPLPTNKTTTVKFTAAHKGTFYFYCSYPGHVQGGMVGKITVH